MDAEQVMDSRRCSHCGKACKGATYKVCNDCYYKWFKQEKNGIFSLLSQGYAFQKKASLMTDKEKDYFRIISDILSGLGSGLILLPQVGLRTVVEPKYKDKTHGADFEELLKEYRGKDFRIDFLITDKDYSPLVFIEINDETHKNVDRQNRDDVVNRICYDAGIPLVTFWLSNGIDKESMKRQICAVLPDVVKQPQEQEKFSWVRFFKRIFLQRIR